MATSVMLPRRKALIPDFRFECAGANLLILSDAFIHAGSDASNQVRRAYTQWVKSKTGRFSYGSVIGLMGRDGKPDSFRMRRLPPGKPFRTPVGYNRSARLFPEGGKL